jgi:two-component system nitrogen regulation sensor histidine kinase GlnL
MNLLTNAVEAAPDRTGHVTVRVAFHPAGARGENSPPVASISVIDNGPGIPEPMQQRIFQPFATTKGTRGTGLGLTVTKRIVEEHRGVLRVESAPAQGATFHILLPADPGKAIDPAATTLAAPSSFGFELEPPF